jgi:hypothetical protein
VRERSTLALVTVYYRPLDYPDKVVAREWTVDASGQRATNQVWFYETVDEAFDDLSSRGMYPLDRDPDDEPHIICTFI